MSGFHVVVVLSGACGVVARIVWSCSSAEYLSRVASAEEHLLSLRGVRITSFSLNLKHFRGYRLSDLSRGTWSWFYCSNDVQMAEVHDELSATFVVPSTSAQASNASRWTTVLDRTPTETIRLGLLSCGACNHGATGFRSA